MRVFVYVIAILVFSGSALKSQEVTAVEACEFFSRTIAVKAPSHLTGDKWVIEDESEFSLNSVTHLGRYNFLAKLVKIDGYRTRSDGSLLGPTAEVSALIMCEADVIDRRVLNISVIDGPLVGSPSENAFSAIYSGPVSESIEVGSRVHQGKY